MSVHAIITLRVCGGCGIEGREAAAQNESLCCANWPGGHSFVDGTGDQAEQLRQLRDSGWRVETFGARDRLVLVKGVDRAGDAFTGHITDVGVLFGEPDDPARRPQRFGRSLSTDPVDAWVNGPQPDAPTFEQLQKHVAKLITRLDLVELDGDRMDVDAALQALEQLRGVMTQTPAGQFALEDARQR